MGKKEKKQEREKRSRFYTEKRERRVIVNSYLQAERERESEAHRKDEIGRNVNS